MGGLSNILVASFFAILRSFLLELIKKTIEFEFKVISRKIGEVSLGPSLRKTLKLGSISIDIGGSESLKSIFEFFLVILIWSDFIPLLVNILIGMSRE